MTKIKILSGALLIGIHLLGAANAQEKPLRNSTAAQTTVVPNKANEAAEQAATSKVQVEEEKFFDDDGGRVFIVRRLPNALDKLTRHSGKVIAEPQTYHIFLGEEWTKPERRSGQSSLTNVLAASSSNAHESAWLKRAGVTILPTATLTLEQPFDFGNERKISDLQIHALLAALFKQKTLPPPQEQNIYVVFLPPGVRSTLGEMIGGKHYVAYHNFFYSESGKVIYAVVPFDESAEQLRASARRVVLETVINPDGNGWH